MVNTSDIPELNRFAPLKDRIALVMEEVLKKCLAPTNQMIRNLIEIEDAYINTSHPDFMGGANAMMSIFSEEAKQQRKEDELFKPQQPIFSLFQERDRPNNNEEVNKDFGFHNLEQDGVRKDSEDKAPGAPRQPDDNASGSWFPFFGHKKTPAKSKASAPAEEQKELRAEDVEDAGER